MFKIGECWLTVVLGWVQLERTLMVMFQDRCSHGPDPKPALRELETLD